MVPILGHQRPKWGACRDDGELLGLGGYSAKLRGGTETTNGNKEESEKRPKARKNRKASKGEKKTKQNKKTFL
jgi:hypothetical protein